MAIGLGTLQPSDLGVLEVRILGSGLTSETGFSFLGLKLGVGVPLRLT